MSLGTYGQMLEANNRAEEALASYAEGIRVLTPHFQALPQAHMRVMAGLVDDYLRLAQALGRSPDEELLSRVRPLLAIKSPS